MKRLLAITLSVLAPSLLAETISQPLFRIEIDDGWTYSAAPRSQSSDVIGDSISIHHRDRTGVLRVQSYLAPHAVDPTRLRDMTNVDWSKKLDWGPWGDFSGYQYSYFEGGTYFQQWWLTNENAVVLFVYSSNTEPKQSESEEVVGIVRSIRASSPTLPHPENTAGKRQGAGAAGER